jgi:REP-associated tyrosine transposase
VDRLVLKTMAVDSPKRRYPATNAACVIQRVEDNAFHLRRRARFRVDRLVLKPMTVASPKANKFPRMPSDAPITLAEVKTYRGFPARLYHRVPHWVEPGAVFHIRIRLDREKEQWALTDPSLAPPILDSARFYEAKMWWHITLFLLMPDHVHTVLSFARDESMSEVIRDWKRFHKRTNHVTWQEGYFDHRLRLDERGTQLSAKLDYIRDNPVTAGSCVKAEDWPWVIDPYGRNGGSARGGTIVVDSPK